ncbi:uncharacterized protein EI90DRAFT_573232 [Cantharellus anzutake]|uniref:uncharacterized protein n=1 Tax=Cantharellus anzutake TaxID=1750568 RepID=UPI001904AA7E|nr:uncharacterized protein EI90DRAFT_573232 [Cantharellus anzutake]KAF8333532.1 hypothetical protein EI90DRAFT_573232 [Cantharellus anzutake]
MDSAEGDEFLDTVEGESAFFQSVARARPAGVHRYMNIVSIRQNINEISGKWVTIEHIWRKLRQYYAMDNIEKIRRQEGAPDDPDFPPPPLPRTPGERDPTPSSSDSPQPAEVPERIEDEEKIWMQAHFRLTFSLPENEFYEMMEERAKRGRNDPSTPESDYRELSDDDDDDDEEEDMKVDKPLSSVTRRSSSHSHSQAPSMSLDPIRASGLAAAEGSESSDLTDPEDDKKGYTDDRESTYSATRRSVATPEDEGGGPDGSNILPVLARKKRELTSDSVASRTTARRSIGVASSSRAKSTTASTKKKRKR